MTDQNKEQVEEITDLVVKTINDAGGKLTKDWLNRKGGIDQVVEELKKEAINRNKKLIGCRLPFRTMPNGKGWYIDYKRVSDNWHDDIIGVSKKRAEEKLHRQVITGLKNLFQQDTVRQFLNGRFSYNLLKKGASEVLTRLTERMGAVDITLLPSVLGNLPGSSRLAASSLLFGSSVGAEIALNFRLKEDILYEYNKTKKETGRLYGDKEIPTRLKRGLIQSAKTDTIQQEIKPSGLNKLLGRKGQSIAFPYRYMTPTEVNGFYSGIIHHDPNFFNCPDGDCGFDLHFSQSCIASREQILSKMEDDFKLNHLMASNAQRVDENNGLLIPIHKLVADIRHGQCNASDVIDSPTDPLSHLTSSAND